MRHHAFAANVRCPALLCSFLSPTLSLGNVFEAAAGRAWTRNASTVTNITARQATASRKQHYSARLCNSLSSTYIVNKERFPRTVNCMSTLAGPSKHTAPATNPPPEVDSVCGDVDDQHLELLRRARSVNMQPSTSHPTPLHTHSSRIVAPFDSDWFKVRDICASYDDPGRDDCTASLPDDSTWLTHCTVVNIVPRDTRPAPTLPTPTTPPELYQNLLFMLYRRRTKPPPLKQVIRYYTHQDRNLHSVRAYNLLISLSLRHLAHGSARKLLIDMGNMGMKGDAETSKLRARWLIATRGWEGAWERVMTRSARVYSWSPTRTTPTISLPVWMEFLASAPPSAVHVRRGSWVSEHRIYHDPHDRSSTEPTDSLYTQRCKLLWNNRPSLTPKELENTPARTIHLTVSMMLRLGKKDAARELTKFYLTRQLSSAARLRSQIRVALNIVHLHIRSAPRGVSSFRNTLKYLIGLFASTSSIRPNSITVYLLLGLLRTSTLCGSLASRYLRTFKKHWGLKVIDSRVRRRVTSLAIKEGKPRIAERMIKDEQSGSWTRDQWRKQRGVLGGVEGRTRRRFLRWEDRRVFKRRGREYFRWKMVFRKLGMLVHTMAAKKSRKTKNR